MQEEELYKIKHTQKGQKLLFEKYYAQMYHIAIRYLKNKEDAEDTLSEAFVRVFRKLETFNYLGAGSFEKWIRTIVINEALRTLLKRKNIVCCDNFEVDDAVCNDESEMTIDQEYYMRIVDSLPDGYRIVFLMYVVDGFSHKEIAEKLYVSISTSKSQLYKARKQMRQKIKQHESEMEKKIRI